MKVAVVSDTHARNRDGKLPSLFWTTVERADAVIHLGDYSDDAFVERMREGKLFHGVAGNCDSAAAKQSLASQRVIRLDGVKVMLVHHFSMKGEGLADRLKALKDAGVSTVLCGHTHKVSDITLDGVRILNPGSACDPRGGGPPTIGMLTVGPGGFDWEIMKMSGKAESS